MYYAYSLEWLTDVHLGIVFDSPSLGELGIGFGVPSPIAFTAIGGGNTTVGQHGKICQAFFIKLTDYYRVSCIC